MALVSGEWLVVSDEILEFRIHKSEIRVVDVLALTSITSLTF